jgi:diguanylate cyclase
MIGARSDRSASSASGRKLNAAVKGEVGEIQRSISIASDLSTLKQNIDKRLDTIQGHVSQHLAEEMARRENAMAKEELLQKRLHKLEHETTSLHTKMVKAKSKALEDPVTGLPNRMAYEERLAAEVARWKRTKTPLALLVWDIDDFKRINDRFGHQAGDKALNVIGRILSSRPREMDFVGRYGGEEFVMLLVDSEAGNTRRIADEIRESVSKSGFHSSGQAEIAITISCGISEFREGDTPEMVFERADEAMYTAKREGKNRVVVA